MAGLIAVATAAVLAGARGFTAIGQWPGDATSETLTRFGLTRGSVDGSTLRRLFARLDLEGLDAALGVWAATRSRAVGGRCVIAIDRKTIGGASTRQAAAPHVVAALAHGNGVVPGQVAVSDKSGEIPVARELLTVLGAAGILAGTVVRMDALHTQHHRPHVTDAGGQYVVTVKGNQEHLHAALKALPWALVSGHTSVEVGYGRRATPTIKVVDVPASMEFTGAVQVAQLRRTITRAGKKSVEVVYLITSARTAHHWPRSLHGSRAAGALRTGCTGYATAPSTKTARMSAPEPRPVSWPACASSPSHSYAPQVMTTTTPRCNITLATRPDLSN